MQVLNLYFWQHKVVNLSLSFSVSRQEICSFCSLLMPHPCWYDRRGAALDSATLSGTDIFQKHFRKDRLVSINCKHGEEDNQS
jgi:hypothetical protein